MLQSPLTITISATDYAMNRVNQDNYGSVYIHKGTDLEIRLDIRNKPPAKGAKFGVAEVERHEIDLKITNFVTGSDGIKRGQTKQYYTVMTVPRGTASSGPAADVAGFSALVSAQAEAILDWAS